MLHMKTGRMKSNQQQAAPGSTTTSALKLRCARQQLPVATNAAPFLLLPTTATWICMLLLSMAPQLVTASDPTDYYIWNVTYATASVLGPTAPPQQVIAINGHFPGPVLTTVTNHHLRINVINNLDEPLLLTWDGIQMRRNSWQDGAPGGTNCAIPPATNWTYQFQAKDQVGSFHYRPATGTQRAAGGFGGVVVRGRPGVAPPFPEPAGDVVLLVGDWYAGGHRGLRRRLDGGEGVGVPDGVHVNGRGGGGGEGAERVVVQAGGTYRFRVANVGVATVINVAVRGHVMRVVEAEGAFTAQREVRSLDVHVGQVYSVLVTMDRPPGDYYVVAAPRFVKRSLWEEQGGRPPVGVAVLHYQDVVDVGGSDGGGGGASSSSSSSPAPAPANLDVDVVDVEEDSDPAASDPVSQFWFSMNQMRSLTSNLSASAARPNPQGSYKYGSIPINATYHLRATGPGPAAPSGSAYRYAVNGVSHRPPDTPLKLADYLKLTNVFTPGSFPTGDDDDDDFSGPGCPPGGPPTTNATTTTTLPPTTTITDGVSVLDVAYGATVELIFHNPDTAATDSWHLSGYSLFVLGFDAGAWSPAARARYNRWDALPRATVAVLPRSWTAVQVQLVNPGMWNLRSQLLHRHYLGQELYVRVVDRDPAAVNGNEVPPPDNLLFCGQLAGLQPPAAPLDQLFPPAPPAGGDQAGAANGGVPGNHSPPVVTLAVLLLRLLLLLV